MATGLKLMRDRSPGRAAFQRRRLPVGSRPFLGAIILDWDPIGNNARLAGGQPSDLTNSLWQRASDLVTPAVGRNQLERGEKAYCASPPHRNKKIPRTSAPLSSSTLGSNKKGLPCNPVPLILRVHGLT